MRYAFALVLTTVLAGDLPVVARLVPGGQNQVELRNTGNHAVTAWSFAVVSATPTGTHRETHWADVYLAEVTRGLPRAEQHLDWLRPGESRTVPVDAAPAGAMVEVDAVIFEDGTALGNSVMLDKIFAQRAAERDDLKKIVDTFNRTLETKHGIAALEQLRDQFAATSGESTARRSAREAVDAFLQKAKASSEAEAEQSLKTYVAFVTRQYEAAAKHANRK